MIKSGVAQRLLPLFLAGAIFVLLVTACSAKRFPDQYGIYTARLDGSDVKMILSDPDEEMTHPRVSPDLQSITFTRYHHKGLDGSASEDGGYGNTEILIAHIDGSKVQTVVPPLEGICSANSSWTPDGHGLIFCTNNNPQRVPVLMIVDLKTRKLTQVPTPKGLLVSDPHWVGHSIVFPVAEKDRQVLWIMNDDGSNAHQLTDPHFAANLKHAEQKYGDYDPWISPDEKSVVSMRMASDGLWHSVVIDVESKKEKDLTTISKIAAPAVDGVPQWSSDGKLIILWHANPKDWPSTGITTVRPDGTHRILLPLPRGYQQMHPSFFPGDASGPDASIIYNARRNPSLR